VGPTIGGAKDRTCVGTVALVDYALLVEAQPASSASRADRASVLTRSLINVTAEPTRDHLREK